MNEILRHSKLIEFLADNTFISSKYCAQMLNVSLSTVKRDITKLAAEGRLKKIRNGAKAIDSHCTNGLSHTPERFFPDVSSIEHYPAKLRIASAAARLCEENDSVIISGGNTTFLMGEYLANRNVQIITNFMPLAYQLITLGHAKLIILGGQYLPERYITISADDETFKNHASRFVFFTGTSVSASGVHTSDLLVYMAEKKVLRYGDKLIALLDSGKVGRHGGKLLASASELDSLITDSNADQATLEALSARGVNIIVV